MNQLGTTKATGFLLLLLALSACTDNTRPRERYQAPTFIQEKLQAVAEVRFNDEETSAFQMLSVGSSIFLTGNPFLFSRWDVGTNPTDPHLAFEARKNIRLFSPDPPFGGWTAQYFGSGAIAVRGSLAYLSGTAGMSVINLAEAINPVEVQRYPRSNSNGETVRDVAYVYKAMAVHPSAPLIYGFSEQDYIYTLDVSQAPNAVIVRQGAYSANGPICCVDGGAVFNGRIFLAMRSSLKMFDFRSDGTLADAGTISKMQAVNVVASSRYLYVQHQPTANSQGALLAGIYVYDKEGNQVGFFPLRPYSFAIDPTDGYLYANTDDSSVTIYRIRWTN